MATTPELTRSERDYVTTLVRRLVENKKRRHKHRKRKIQQLTKELDNVLDALVAGEFTEIDGAEPDLEESGRKMEEAVSRLEAELFTEEEKILVNRVKELERNYQTDHDQETFAKGIEALINELTKADEKLKSKTAE